jgi:hypothetical protein
LNYEIVDFKDIRVKYSVCKTVQFDRYEINITTHTQKIE